MKGYALISRVLNRALWGNCIALSIGPFVGIAYCLLPMGGWLPGRGDLRQEGLGKRRNLCRCESMDWAWPMHLLGPGWLMYIGQYNYPIGPYLISYLLKYDVFFLSNICIYT